MKRPNIVFITCDQLRMDALGCYGNPVIKTPNIDALAGRGVRFSNMFTAYPVCAPNRATLATGRYPSVHRLRLNGIALPESELTWMECLRRSGYRTAGMGKMHFGAQWRFPEEGGQLSDPDPELAINPQPDSFPWYGFDEAWITEDNRVGPYDEYLKKHGYDIWQDPHSFSSSQIATQRSNYPVEHHQTTWIADRSIEFLEKQTGERPFCLWTSFVAPHHPFVVPAPYDTMYDPADMPLPAFDPQEPSKWPETYVAKYRAKDGGHEGVGMDVLTDDEFRKIIAAYYGSVSQIDDQIGRIIETLKQKGQFEDTIILFTSDHGEMLGDHHLLFKGTTFDEVTCVPFIVACPGIESAAEATGLCCSVDVMPTLLELLGEAVPAAVQGRSLVECCSNPATAVREAVLIETRFPSKRALRTNDALVSFHGSGARGELYDLKQDPKQQNNLWDDPGAEAFRLEMMEKLATAMAMNVDPLPIPEGFC